MLMGLSLCTGLKEWQELYMVMLREGLTLKSSTFAAPQLNTNKSPLAWVGAKHGKNMIDTCMHSGSSVMVTASIEGQNNSFDSKQHGMHC